MSDILTHISKPYSLQAQWDQDAIWEAVMVAVEQSPTGEFSVNDVRPFVRRDVDPHAIGGAFCGFVKSRRLTVVDTARSGNHKSRNAMKRVNLYRLAS